MDSDAAHVLPSLTTIQLRQELYVRIGASRIKVSCRN